MISVLSRIADPTIGLRNYKFRRAQSGLACTNFMSFYFSNTESRNVNATFSICTSLLLKSLCSGKRNPDLVKPYMTLIIFFHPGFTKLYGK